MAACVGWAEKKLFLCSFYATDNKFEITLSICCLLRVKLIKFVGIQIWNKAYTFNQDVWGFFNVHICAQIIDFIAGMQPHHPPTQPILQATEDGFHLLMSSPTWFVYFDILIWGWWRTEFERIELNKDSFLQPPANSVYMTDAPPPYPGINGNNGYRLETRLVTRLGNRLKFARLEKNIARIANAVQVTIWL